MAAIGGIPGGDHRRELAVVTHQRKALAQDVALVATDWMQGWTPAERLNTRLREIARSIRDVLYLSGQEPTVGGMEWLDYGDAESAAYRRILEAREEDIEWLPGDDEIDELEEHDIDHVAWVEGQRIIMVADPDEGFPAEEATVIGLQDDGEMLTVTGDVDGVCEVHVHDVVWHCGCAPMAHPYSPSKESCAQ
jgi:hypothetical protein